MRLCDLFEQTVIVISEEGGVGCVIPGVNTTSDVGPAEIKKQAKKWGFKVSKDGVPPKIKTNGQVNETLVDFMENLDN